MNTGDESIHWDDEEPYFIPGKYRFQLGNLEMSGFVDSSSGKSYTVFSLLVEEDGEVKKDKEWAQKEVDRYLSYEGVNEARKALVFAKGVIDQLDEPEVLSQEWIRENQELKGVHFFVNATKLQYLLIPKQELPVIPKYVAQYLEFAKSDVSLMRVLELASTREELARWEEEYDWISANDETFARAWLSGYKVAEERLYYALVKGHELITNDDTFKYWNFDTFNNCIFLSNRDFGHEIYLTEMSKEEWNKLGINDSNADFVRVEE